MITPKEASKFLGNVPEDKVFRVYLGPSIRNLYELAENLEKMSDESFYHHVTPERNDFENWINDVIKDVELAKSIANIKNQTTMSRIIKKRIDVLERIKLEDHTAFKERFVSGVVDFAIGILIGFIIGILIVSLVR